MIIVNVGNTQQIRRHLWGNKQNYGQKNLCHKRVSDNKHNLQFFLHRRCLVLHFGFIWILDRHQTHLQTGHSCGIIQPRTQCCLLEGAASFSLTTNQTIESLFIQLIYTRAMLTPLVQATLSNSWQLFKSMLIILNLWWTLSHIYFTQFQHQAYSLNDRWW